MTRPGHNPRYDAGVSALMRTRDRTEIPNRPYAAGEPMADGCWSCTHYANWGGNTCGTPPWSTCRFRMDHPACGRWELATEAPWRFNEDWRDLPAENHAHSPSEASARIPATDEPEIPSALSVPQDEHQTPTNTQAEEPS